MPTRRPETRSSMYSTVAELGADCRPSGRPGVSTKSLASTSTTATTADAGHRRMRRDRSCESRTALDYAEPSATRSS